MIRFNDDRHGEAIAKSVGAVYNPDVDAVISRTEDGYLVGGMLYQSYTGSSIEVHAAGWNEHWYTRDMMWLMHHYPFVQLDCKLLFANIPARNKKSLDICARLGFKELIHIEDVYPDCALKVLVMKREDCRWLKIKCPARRAMENADSGKEVQSSKAARLWTVDSRTGEGSGPRL